MMVTHPLPQTKQYVIPPSGKPKSQQKVVVERNRSEEIAEKLEQLRQFCRQNTIPFSKEDSRSDLLKKVKSWRKSNKEKDARGENVEEKTEIQPFEPPAVVGIRAEIDVIPLGNEEGRRCKLTAVFERPRVVKSEESNALPESSGDAEGDAEAKDNDKDLAVRFTAELRLVAKGNKGEDQALAVVSVVQGGAGEADDEMEAVFDGLRLGCEYELVIRCHVIVDEGEEEYRCPVSFPSSCDALSQQPRAEDAAPRRNGFVMPSLTPLAPRRLHLVSSKKRSVKVGWDGCPCSGGNHVVEYVAQWRTGENEEFVECYTGKKSAFELAKLSPGMEVEVRVKGRNVIGSSGWSPSASFATAPAAPSAPGPVRHVNGYPKVPTELYVEWDPPKETYGAEIQAYRVEMRLDDGDYRIVYNGIQDLDFPERCRITSGLRPSCKATFRVVAVNIAGASPPSPEILLATLGDVATPPRSLSWSVESGSNTVELKWKSPLSTNGAKVTAYKVEAQEQGPRRGKSFEIYAGTGSACHCTTSVLKRGKQYNIVAFAENYYGWSRASTACLVQIDATAPKTLEIAAVATVESDQRFVRLKWKAATEDILNGAQLDRYEVVLNKLDTATDVTTPPPAASTTDTNATGSYQLFNPAIEVESESDDSLVESKFTVGDVIEAVYSVDYLFYLGKIRNVRRQGRLFEYEVWFSGYGNVEWVAESSMRRRFQVDDICRAINYATQEALDARVTAVADDKYFVQFVSRALAIQETRIQDLVAAASQERKSSDAEVDRAHPKRSRSSTQGSYTLKDRVAYTGRAAQCRLAVEQGSAFEARVRVVTGAGMSELNAATVFQTQGAPAQLSAPTIVRVSRTKVWCKHGNPVVASTARIDGYRVSIAPCKLVKACAIADNAASPQVRAKISGGFEVVNVSKKEESVVVARLESGKCYAIRSQAQNQYGNAPWSDPVIAKTEIGTPLQPSAIRLTHKQQGREFDVKVEISSPEWNGGSNVCGYVVDLRMLPAGGKEQRSTLSLAAANCTLPGVPAGATLNVRAQAKNHVGTGAYSSTQTVHLPIVVPGVVEGVVLKLTGSNGIKCTWRRPSFRGGGAILGYEAQIEPALEDPASTRSNGEEDVASKYLTPPVSFDESKLDSDLRYASKNFLHIKPPSGCNAIFCRVRAMNKRGAGKFSDWKLVEQKRCVERTELARPVVRVMSLSPVTLQWEKVEAETECDVEYLVEHKVINESKRFRQVYRGENTSFVFKDAQQGHGYVFRVRSISKKASSPFSLCVNVKVPGARRVSVSEDTRALRQLQKEKAGRENPRRRRARTESDGDSTGNAKLAKAALRWRRMPWYRRYPFISIPLLLLACYMTLRFCLFVYYA